MSLLTQPKKTDFLKVRNGRVADYLGVKFPRLVYSGLTRDGAHYIEKEVDAWSVQCSWACWTECDLMNVTEELQKQYESAAELWKAYEKRLHDFRSAVKNDISSLEAGARKTTEAVVRMNKAYSDVFVQLNSAEMATAIANAERLATAMKALSELQPHKLAFTVNGTNEG